MNQNINAAVLTDDEVRALIATCPYWHHRFEIVPGVETPGAYAPAFMMALLAMPEDLTGQRVLEIGPSDGYFSMMLARRGASLTVVDYREKHGHGFAVMEQLSGIKADYRVANLYDVTPAEYGVFDHVLCLGVLYHLPDMLKALTVLRAVCSGTLYLETETLEGEPEPVARYYRDKSLGGDLTNFWVPSVTCVTDMLHDTQFETQRTQTWGSRMLAVARAVGYPTSYKLKLGYGVCP